MNSYSTTGVSDTQIWAAQVLRLSVSLSVSLPLSPPLSPSLSLSPSLPPSLGLSLSVYPSLSLSLSLSLPLSSRLRIFAHNEVGGAHMLSLNLLDAQAALLDKPEDVSVPVAPPLDHMPIEPMSLPLCEQ